MPHSTTAEAVNSNESLGLSLRQRMTWAAHFYKAVAKQYHQPFAIRISPLIPADGIVIDVGAHAGQFTKLFAAMAPQGRIYASEPGRYALSILKRMVKLRGLRNVEITSVGFSDKESTELLHVPLKKSGSIGFGLSHLGTPLESSTRVIRTEPIQLTTIDRFVAKHQIERVAFIKADIEGWEFHLLAGARETIRKHKPGLLLEVDESMLARANSSASAVFAEFTGLGYRFFRTDESTGYTLTPVTEFTGNGDYLFVSEENAKRIA
jgi:FkbM family methyltransferase